MFPLKRTLPACLFSQAHVYKERRCKMTQRIVIRNGTVLTGDKARGSFTRADVLIEGSLIRAVQPGIEASDSTVIEASGMIVMPGFVDAHRHTWEGTLKQLAANSDLGDYASRILAKLGPIFRPEDAYIGTLIGALEALDAGITALFDWSHIQNTPEHTDAVIRGLQESGLRAVFGYGVPNTGPQWSYESQLNHSDDARRVRTQYFSSSQQLMTMAMALRGPEFSTMDVTRHDWKLARDLGLPISVHVGSGPFGVPYRAIEHLSEAHLLGPDTQYVHTTTLTDAAMQLIAESGGTAAVTPAWKGKRSQPRKSHHSPGSQAVGDHSMRSVLSVANPENEAYSTLRTFAFPGWGSVRFRRPENLLY